MPRPLGEPRVLFPPGRGWEAVRPEIVLVQANVLDELSFLAGFYRENLGILVLASHLEAIGIPFGIAEATLFRCSLDETAALSVRHAPRWVGISAFATQFLGTSLDLAAAVKALRPEVRIVLGGHAVAFVAREVLERHPEVDAVIRGDGEDPLVRLLAAPDEDAWANIPGLSYRQHGRVTENAVAPFSSDLDGSPLPSRFVRDLVERDPALSRSPLMLFTSKGCYGRCAYCTVHEFHGGWKGRSAARIVDELEALLTRFPKRIVNFWDDQFTGPGRSGRRRALELAEELTRRRLDVVFHVTIRPSDLTEEVVAALARAGLRSVFIGVESSSQEILDGFFQKRARPGQTLEALDRLRRHGVHRIIVGFILFHPEMSWESFRRDLDFLDGFPSIGIETLTSRLGYYPGAKLWNGVRERLGLDAYRKPYLPPLPGASFDLLYAACRALTRQAMETHALFTGLEDRALDDLRTIDLLAECRMRQFRFFSSRARAVADLLERGADHRDVARRSCDEALQETLRILERLERELGGDDFQDLLLATGMLGYRSLMDRPDGPPPSQDWLAREAP